jgi:hypothetical protein
MIKNFEKYDNMMTYVKPKKYLKNINKKVYKIDDDLFEQKRTN